jgi:hypothetical protein
MLFRKIDRNYAAAVCFSALAAFIVTATPLFSQVNNPGVQVSGTPANNDCAKFVVSGGNVQSITTAGAACGAGGGTVSSVFGRTGAVVATSGDYNFNQLSGNYTLAQGPTIGAATFLGSIAGGTPAALTATQATALLNLATASLQGLLPAWPNNTTTFFRGDGSYATLNCAAITNASAQCATGYTLPAATSSTLGGVKPDGTTITNSTGAISVTYGTGSNTAAQGNDSRITGAAQLIASGTSAMGTGAISSATCATVVTTSATGVATTDAIIASFNGDPTAVTGYVPLTTGMLTIIAYPTANNVNWKVCNNTSASITPGAITLNWRVVR